MGEWSWASDSGSQSESVFEVRDDFRGRDFCCWELLEGFSKIPTIFFHTDESNEGTHTHYVILISWFICYILNHGAYIGGFYTWNKNSNSNPRDPITLSNDDWGK